MDNIIQFPRKYSGEENLLPTSEEEVNSKIDLLKYHHIHETLATVIPMLFANLEVAGFDCNDESEENLKDGAFVVEAIRSILCKHYGLDHPFQEIAQNVFLPDIDHEGMLKVVEELNIKFKDAEKGNS